MKLRSMDFGNGSSRRTTICDRSDNSSPLNHHFWIRPPTTVSRQAEKALKAFLVLHDISFSKTHLLSHLVEQCKDVDPRFAKLSEAAEFLTPFATSFRYPGDVLEPMQDDVVTGLKLAEQIVGFVLALMPDAIGQDLSILS